MNKTFGIDAEVWIALIAIGALVTALGTLVVAIVALRLRGMKETSRLAILLLPGGLLATLLIAGVVAFIVHKEAAESLRHLSTNPANDLDAAPETLFRASRATLVRRYNHSTALLGRASEGVRAMQEKGLLRVEADLRKAWIDPGVWETMDAQRKTPLPRSRSIARHAIQW